MSNIEQPEKPFNSEQFSRLVGSGFSRIALVVYDNCQERRIDLETTVIFDEPELLELIHEEVHTGSGGPDHFGQRFLRDFRQLPQRLVSLLTIAGKEKQRAGQPLFAGIEQL